jgi:hypothetical protein
LENYTWLVSDTRVLVSFANSARFVILAIGLQIVFSSAVFAWRCASDGDLHALLFSYDLSAPLSAFWVATGVVLLTCSTRSSAWSTTTWACWIPVHPWPEQYVTERNISQLWRPLAATCDASRQGLV